MFISTGFLSWRYKMPIITAWSTPGLALIGASTPEQVTDCCGAIANLEFSADELAQIDAISGEKDINVWARSAD